MGSSKGSQTQTTNSDPWKAQQPYLTTGFEQAQQLYNQGAPLTAPLGTTTQNALGRIENRAMAGSDLLRTGQNTLQQTAGGGWLGANPAGGFYQNLMGGGVVNPALGLAGGMAQQGSTNPALAMLQGTARGDYLNANPYLDRMYNQAAGRVSETFRNSVTPGIDSQYARMGRLGSGAFAQARNDADKSLGTALGDLATNIYGGNYATERQNQQQAMGTIGTLANADYGNRLAAVNTYGALGQQGIANQTTGALGLSSAYGDERARMQQAALSSPELAAADYNDPARLLTAGEMRDSYAQALLEDPYRRLQQYWSVVGQPLGTTATQITPMSRSRLAGAASGAASGATTGYMVGGPWGAAIGGIGGGIAGAFG